MGDVMEKERAVVRFVDWMMPWFIAVLMPAVAVGVLGVLAALVYHAWAGR
jgi:hypothetical protein